MPVIAVINRKGGCGKSTLACHLAVWLAQQSPPSGSVMLADVDVQHTLTHWLQRRRHRSPGTTLQGWVTDARHVLRPPRGVRHSVLDSPGGLRGFELARLLVFADVVLIPVCDSAFDADAAADCLSELRSHPRVASGKVRLALVGVRVSPGSDAARRMSAWAQTQGVAFVGAIRSSQAYIGFAASGLTLFDAEASGFDEERQDWQPLLQWVSSAIGAPVDTAAVPSPGELSRASAAPLRPFGAPAGPDRGREAPASRFMVEHLSQAAPTRPGGLLRRLWGLAADRADRAGRAERANGRQWLA